MLTRMVRADTTVTCDCTKTSGLIREADEETKNYKCQVRNVNMDGAC